MIQLRNTINKKINNLGTGKREQRTEGPRKKCGG